MEILGLSLALILLLGLIVFVTQALEAVTGFGSTVLAVPFFAMIMSLAVGADGLQAAVAVSATHTWLLVIYVIIVSWKNIVWKEFRFIALHVFIGLPIGAFLFQFLPEVYLRALLSVFMIGVGIHGIYITRRNRRLVTSSTAPVKKNFLMRFILFLGGIIHGAFASGGPFIVLYAARALRDKTLFRVTMCLIWFCLNSALLIWWTFKDLVMDGVWTGGVWMQNDGFALYATLITLPFLAVSILVGNYLHHRASEYVFRLVVFALLLAGGFVVMYNVANNLLAPVQNNEIEVTLSILTNICRVGVVM